MRKLVLLILLLITANVMTNVLANPVSNLLERFQKGLSERFEFKIDPTSEGDFFELSGGGKIVTVCANNYTSAAFGVNWYLKYHCGMSLSFCEDQFSPLPEKLPAVKERHFTPLTVNFYMNYCTFSYTTAFWKWDRWEREIDLMALNGITMPMAMVGAEVVWKNVLRQYGYSNQEIKEFLCGPAYFGWLLMGNLEQLGGPLPDEWFSQQETLQKKILARMREFGMTPVLQGFFGMVPSSLQKKYPDAHYVEQGLWNGLNRPPVLDPSDPLFKKMAKTWYAETEKLYGKANAFGGDLFHEGGKNGDINVTEAARAVQQTMMEFNPKAVWVIQSWGGNPRKELLDGLKKENTLVVDLCSEFWSNWKVRKGYEGFPWLWSHITNYGANVGLHGRLDAIASKPIEAMTDVNAGPVMKGIGSTPEGIEVNPVVFDLVHEMRWHSENVDVDEWLKKYVERRYGSKEKNLKEAWLIFHKTAYGTFEGHRRPSESVFCALPSLKRDKITASAWSQSRIFYNPDFYAQGVALLLESAPQLRKQATYQYDAIDLVRQYIADLGRESYYNLVDAYHAKDVEKYTYWSKRFLELIKDQDTLLSSHPRFFVARWLDVARDYSDNLQNKDLYEHNARMLIGTWTEGLSPVRDYAHKEWGGMLLDYYLPRWSSYITYLKLMLEGKKSDAPDSFQMEKVWVNAHNRYKMTPDSDPISVAVAIFNKYYFNRSMAFNISERTFLSFSF